MNELAGQQNSPPQQRRGGAKRRGGVGQVIDFLIEPPRRFAPPLLCQGGEFALFQFIHTLYDRAYKGTRANKKGGALKRRLFFDISLVRYERVPEIVLKMIQVQVVLLADVLLEFLLIAGRVPWNVPLHRPWL